MALAGLLDRVTFVLGDILDERTWHEPPSVDAAFHVHHFVRSGTRPQADALLERVFVATRNVALVLPPQLDLRDLAVSWCETKLRV